MYSVKTVGNTNSTYIGSTPLQNQVKSLNCQCLAPPTSVGTNGKKTDSPLEEYKYTKLFCKDHPYGYNIYTLSKLPKISTPNQKLGVSWEAVRSYWFGFVVEFRNDEITNVQQMEEYTVVHEPSQVFELWSNEHVKQITFEYGEEIKVNNDARLCPVVGVRFLTNKRVSQTIGSTGIFCETIVADDGYALCNLVGYTYSDYIVQFMVRSCPIASYIRYNSHQLCTELKPTPANDINVLTFPKSKISVAVRVKALVIQVYNYQVKKITPLSSEEYYCMMRFATITKETIINTYEHLLTLDDGEHINSLEIGAVVNECITGIRFTTNSRTSRWYGTPASSSTIISAPRGNAIWGFYFNKHDDKEEFGCVYHPL